MPGWDPLQNNTLSTPKKIWFAENKQSAGLLKTYTLCFFVSLMSVYTQKNEREIPIWSGDNKDQENAQVSPTKSMKSKSDTNPLNWYWGSKNTHISLADSMSGAGLLQTNPLWLFVSLIYMSKVRVRDQSIPEILRIKGYSSIISQFQFWQ